MKNVEHLLFFLQKLLFFTQIKAALSFIFGPSSWRQDTWWTSGLLNPGPNSEDEDTKCKQWCDVDGYVCMD